MIEKLTDGFWKSKRLAEHVLEVRGLRFCWVHHNPWSDDRAEVAVDQSFMTMCRFTRVADAKGTPLGEPEAVPVGSQWKDEDGHRFTVTGVIEDDQAYRSVIDADGAVGREFDLYIRDECTRLPDAVPTSGPLPVGKYRDSVGDEWKVRADGLVRVTLASSAIGPWVDWAERYHTYGPFTRIEDEIKKPDLTQQVPFSNDPEAARAFTDAVVGVAGEAFPGNPTPPPGYRIVPESERKCIVCKDRPAQNGEGYFSKRNSCAQCWDARAAEAMEAHDVRHQDEQRGAIDKVLRKWQAEAGGDSLIAGRSSTMGGPWRR